MNKNGEPEQNETIKQLDALEINDLLFPKSAEIFVSKTNQAASACIKIWEKLSRSPIN